MFGGTEGSAAVGEAQPGQHVLKLHECSRSCAMETRQCRHLRAMRVVKQYEGGDEEVLLQWRLIPQEISKTNPEGLERELYPGDEFGSGLGMSY